jgi:hypothetical protein
MFARLIAAVMTGATAALAQTPAPCVVDTLTAGFPTRWLGTRVGQITILARNVEAHNAFMSAAVSIVHQPTQLGVISSELSFAAGQEMDSLAVLESVRRLRGTSLFSDVLLEGTQCGSSQVTDFTLWTRDAWSIRGDFRAGRLSSRASISDVNIWGSARSVTLRGEEVDGRRSVVVAAADPYLFDTRIRAALLLRSYEDGRAWNWSLRTREFSPRDEWRGSLLSTQLRRVGDDSATATHTDVERRATTFVVSRRALLLPRAVWAVEAGVEQERANLVVLQPGPQLGRPEVHREFVAPLIGVERRAMGVEAIDWLVPGQAPAELPVGLDGDVVTSVGHELHTNTLVTHMDGWFGGTMRPATGTILTGDVWWSGYWGQDSLSNGTARIAFGVYQRASRGMWILRGTGERLYNPDPDVFALSTADPMLRTLTPESRLAESALNVSVERSLHLRTQDRSWVLDGAIFTAYSERHRSVSLNVMETAEPRVVIVGIGLRRVRTQPTQAPLRLDIGRAVWRSSNLPNRWIILLSTTPWINAGRMRDGAREAR